MFSERRRKRQRACVLAAALLATLAWPVQLVRSQAGQSSHVTVLTGAHPRYRTAADAFAQELRSRGVGCSVVGLPPAGDATAHKQTLEAVHGQSPSVIATAGVQATNFALRNVADLPVLFLMVPNALDAGFVERPDRYGNRVAGLAGDISPSDWIRWITQINPKCRKLAVPYSAASERTLEALRNAAAEYHIEIKSIESRRDRFPEALKAIRASRCDGALMLADPKVYNSATVQQLLLWGVRNQKSVWAFSENVVKAGALGGQFVDPAAHGRQAAELAAELVAGKTPADIGIRYHRKPGQAVNVATAERIKIRLSGRLSPTVVRYGEDR